MIIMSRYFYSLLLIIFITSCITEKQDNNEDRTTVKPLLSVKQNHLIVRKVFAKYDKEIEGWKAYQNLQSFIGQFQKITPNEALSNALELRDLTKALKDSVKPKIFENNAFKSRVNVLYTEALRLADMTYIPAIKAKEVNSQIDKVLSSYNALNQKINTVFTQKLFEDGIDFDDAYVGIDTTKIDSVSKINLNKHQINDSLLVKKKYKIDNKRKELFNKKERKLQKKE